MFRSAENQAVVSRLIREVRGMNENFLVQHIRGVVHFVGYLLLGCVHVYRRVHIKCPRAGNLAMQSGH